MSNAVRRNAASWLVTLQGDDVSEADRAAFRLWLEADPRHRDAFDRIARAVDAVRALGPALAEFDIETRLPERSAWLGQARGLAAALAAFVLLIAGIGWWGFVPTSASTGLGEQRTIALSDGSRVELNTGSTLIYRRGDLVLGSLRKVRLEHGEAFFEVARNERRPFEVEADHAVVRVLGTTFSVGLQDASSLTVLVREGAVSVRRSGAAAEAGERVGTGEGLRFEGGAFERAALEGGEIERRLAWRSGMLQFNGQPLAVVTAEVTRHTGAQFRFADTELAREPFVAYFRANDLDGFVTELERARGVRVERQGARILIAREEQDL